MTLDVQAEQLRKDIQNLYCADHLKEDENFCERHVAALCLDALTRAVAQERADCAIDVERFSARLPSEIVAPLVKEIATTIRARGVEAG